MSENGLRKLFRINKIKILMSVTWLHNFKYKYLVRTAESWTLNDGNWQSISITNLDIADGIVVCKFNKPCEVEITNLACVQQHRNCIAKSVHENNKPNCFPFFLEILRSRFIAYHWLYGINIDKVSVFNIIS